MSRVYFLLEKNWIDDLQYNSSHTSIYSHFSLQQFAPSNELSLLQIHMSSSRQYIIILRYIGQSLHHRQIHYLVWAIISLLSIEENANEIHHSLSWMKDQLVQWRSSRIVDKDSLLHTAVQYFIASFSSIDQDACSLFVTHSQTVSEVELSLLFNEWDEYVTLSREILNKHVKNTQLLSDCCVISSLCIELVQSNASFPMFTFS